MSFLSGVAHIAGNVVGPAAELGGAVTSVGGLVKNPLSNSLTSTGHNITNPNVTLSNTGGILQSNDPAFTGAGAYGAPITKASAGSIDSGTTSSTPNNTGAIVDNTGGTGGTSSNVNAINSAYDTLSNYYKGLLGTISPQQQIAQGQTDTQYNDNLQSLGDQLQAANANLDNQANIVNQSYAKSLQQLGNNIRNTAQGQLNALGIGGAGDSSATFMLAHALANLQNQQQGYMNQDMNNQLSQIALNRQSDQSQFGDQKKQLDDWKTQQYQNIGQQYAQLAAQINEKLAGNEQYRQLALANAGQWASNQAQAVDNTLANSLNALNSTYQNMRSPNISLGNLPTYQATQVQIPQTQVSAALQQQSTPEQVMQYFSPFAYKQDQNQDNFSY